MKTLSDSPCLGKWKNLYFSNTIFVYIFIILQTEKERGERNVFWEKRLTTRLVEY